MLRNWVVVASLVSASAAFAAPQGLDPVRGLIGVEAGNYSFVQYDKVQLEKIYLDEIARRSKEDRDYFLAAVKDIEAQFVSFLKDTVYGENGLKKMSDRAKGSGTFATAEEFLSAINEYNTGKAALETKINTLVSLPGALPSQVDVDADGSGIKKLPNYGQIKFDALVAFYASRLNQITEMVSNLQQNVRLANGNIVIIREGSGKGLILEAQEILLSPEKLKELREQVKKYKMYAPGAEDKINKYTVYVKQLVQQYVKTYGTTERWRFHNERDKLAKRQAAKEIIDAFRTRSYLRAMYGMPLGTIGIRYQKKIANLDKLTVATKALMNTIEEPVWEQKEMIEIEQAYRNALEVASDRNSSLFDGNVSVLGRINGLLTFLGGYGELADGLNTVLKLMAADLYEEKLIMQPGGLRQMASFYKSRYYLTEDDKKYYRALAAAYDPDTANDDGSDAFGDVGAISAGSLRNQFEDVMVELRTMEDKLRLAKELEDQIANAVNYQKSKPANNRKERHRLLDE